MPYSIDQSEALAHGRRLKGHELIEAFGPKVFEPVIFNRENFVHVIFAVSLTRCVKWVADEPAEVARCAMDCRAQTARIRERILAAGPG